VDTNVAALMLTSLVPLTQTDQSAIGLNPVAVMFVMHFTFREPERPGPTNLSGNSSAGSGSPSSLSATMSVSFLATVIEVKSFA